MKQPNAREFEETSEKYGNIWRKVAIACCRECGSKESIGISQGHALLPAHAIEKKFRQKGWTIGSNQQWDICPICTEYKKITKPHLTIVEKEKPEMKLVEPAPVVNPEPPRTMQREDRRIIFQKLNEVYLDEKRGYDNGWSDLKVSQDLGVPRVWVAEVRDENFGPTAANPDIDEFKRAMADVAEIKQHLEEYRALVQRIDELNLVGKITRLEKLAAEVQKHIP